LDYEKQLLAFTDASQSLYKQMQFRWEPTGPSVKFGYYDEVDYYPHCDGEHDRWGIQWMTQRQVSLNEAESSVTVK
jgi:regulatory protein YycI of two-component signal transduction system YycFG